MKRDYVAFMPKPDTPKVAHKLAVAFVHYNEKRPDNALECCSHSMFGRLADSVILGVTPYPEFQGQLHDTERLETSC